ncbi:AAA family ATPase [Micromonospora cathayae]|uniref:AAA family ATPase n=1 Tax=Micromonospora cathayae TaxID=3028804 RepID=A0ABY7ZN30_9ACTN|nr:AAA family ATPase [Micromonospora sp. HUAS 3]WDZ83384.1 AAA family ATPase [Micromonospora sp. HUAS 3]
MRSFPPPLAGQAPTPRILPYSLVVGQEALKLALEVSYVAPQVGGVLASGERGTAKSTVVRSFAMMMSGRLPVTLPINTTDDRLLGGWQIDALMRAEAKPYPGLLEQASAQAGGMLYVDEVNLLDDHLVNLILDVSSTGVLTVQREGLDVQKEVRFQLVGTMNPEEGGLRPQLLDRFGLMVTVPGDPTPDVRRRVLETVLRFEDETERGISTWLDAARATDERRRDELTEARQRFHDVGLAMDLVKLCARLAGALRVVGHRGELVLAKAAGGLAAIRQLAEVSVAEIRDLAPMAFAHRRPTRDGLHDGRWTEEDEHLLADLIGKG